MSRVITKEVAAQLRAARIASGNVGGRPKGSLSPQTIAKINNKKALEAAIQKRAGRVLNNLLLGSDALDTQASKELLERGFGKVAQQLEVSGTFTLRAIHARAIDAPKIIEGEVLRVIDAPQEEEKKEG